MFNNSKGQKEQKSNQIKIQKNQDFKEQKQQDQKNEINESSGSVNTDSPYRDQDLNLLQSLLTPKASITQQNGETEDLTQVKQQFNKGASKSDSYLSFRIHTLTQEKLEMSNEIFSTISQQSNLLILPENQISKYEMHLIEINANQNNDEVSRNNLILKDIQPSFIQPSQICQNSLQECQIDNFNISPYQFISIQQKKLPTVSLDESKILATILKRKLNKEQIQRINKKLAHESRQLLDKLQTTFNLSGSFSFKSLNSHIDFLPNNIPSDSIVACFFDNDDFNEFKEDYPDLFQDCLGNCIEENFEDCPSMMMDQEKIDNIFEQEHQIGTSKAAILFCQQDNQSIHDLQDRSQQIPIKQIGKSQKSEHLRKQLTVNNAQIAEQLSKKKVEESIHQFVVELQDKLQQVIEKNEQNKRYAVHEMWTQNNQCQSKEPQQQQNPNLRRQYVRQISQFSTNPSLQTKSQENKRSNPLDIKVSSNVQLVQLDQANIEKTYLCTKDQPSRSNNTEQCSNENSNKECHQERIKGNRKMELQTCEIQYIQKQNNPKQEQVDIIDDNFMINQPNDKVPQNRDKKQEIQNSGQISKRQNQSKMKHVFNQQNYRPSANNSSSSLRSSKQNKSQLADVTRDSLSPESVTVPPQFTLSNSIVQIVITNTSITRLHFYSNSQQMNNYQDSSNNSDNTILTTFIRIGLDLPNEDAIDQMKEDKQKTQGE